ncbi:MAG TPA: hypothetical protein VFJ91_12675 [Gaiellaceae bacterium]|nr:hypothetical protein [Gaiellaceae bacterium]
MIVRNLRLGVVLAALVLPASAAAATSGGAGPQVPIAVAVYEVQKGGTAIWDGGPATLKRVRFLKQARLAQISPSGASVAFVRYSGDGFDLFHTGVYGGREAKLLHVAGSRETSLAFSPDSRTVAFASPRGIELTGIVPGRSHRVLALPARWRGSTYQALRFSPDGRSLAFSRTWGNGRAGTLHNELAIVSLAGGARSLVANPEPYSAQYRPSFSPDGARIAFAAADGSIDVVPAAGGKVVRLTPPKKLGEDSSPLFSPDGSTVAFTRKSSGHPTDVWLVGSDGAALRRLTTTKPFAKNAPRVGASALAWSPDGVDVLAFRHDRLASVAIDGQAETTLARTGVQYEIDSAVWHG